ncbi:MAG: ThiF family adenylyltransferase [Methylobacteriaceae bacterium]|jgi:molybdopterin/thiamine biosynthesis adenylyltransferase|nr:ThiF family adenylyltransferase [Methylobacteriaceae bacterium]
MPETKPESSWDLTDKASGRYLRHNLIDWFSQEEVAAARVAVIGAGAIGNETIKNLTLLGVGMIDVFDFDTIELHNLTRSVLFREFDVGRNKAECAAERARELDPNVNVRAFAGDFRDHMSVHQASTYDTVICCVDNFEARIRLSKMCLLAGTDFINTGIDSRSVEIGFYPLSRGTDIPCYECGLPPTVYQRVARRYSCGWLKKAAFRENAVPTTIITSAMAGAAAAAIALDKKFAGTHPGAVRILIDTKTFRQSIVDLTKDPECGGCAGIDGVPLVIPTKRTVAVVPGMEAEEFTSSDAIITDCACKNGCRLDVSHIVLRRADEFDDRLFECPVCKSNSVNVDIRHTFTGAELIGFFDGKPFPADYLLTKIKDHTVCYDLED